MKGGKKISAFAFRNGSQRVSTLLSTTIEKFHWEGKVLKETELRMYRRDPSSLHDKFFKRVTDLSFGFDVESDEECEIIEELLEEKSSHTV